MMNSALRNLQLALGLLTGAGYLAVSYFVATSRHAPMAAVWMTLLPLAAIVLAAVWRSRLRWPGMALGGLLAVLGLQHANLLRTHVVWLYFAQHAGTMGGLAALFGSTLAAGSGGALCSRIAAGLATTPLDARSLRYTWFVTLAWTVYFAVSCVASVSLFFAAPLRVWSAFADLLTPVSLVVMFGGEYLLRLRVLPVEARFALFDTVRAWRTFSRHGASR